MKIILASSSKNRSDLFAKMGIKFDICPPDYEENIIENQSPTDQIQEFALGKAQSVYDQFKDEGSVLIMGFDSMIAFEGRSLGKPKDKQAVFTMLKEFIGKPQDIMTGVALIGNYKGEYFESVFYESTSVQFRNDISDDDITRYLEFGDWEGKCGAYSILGTGIYFLENIDGDFQNIIGVPVLKIGEKLREITEKSPFGVFQSIS